MCVCVCVIHTLYILYFCPVLIVISPFFYSIGFRNRKFTIRKSTFNPEIKDYCHPTHGYGCYSQMLCGSMRTIQFSIGFSIQNVRLSAKCSYNLWCFYRTFAYFKWTSGYIDLTQKNQQLVCWNIPKWYDNYVCIQLQWI